MNNYPARIQKEWAILKAISYKGVFYYRLKGTDLIYY